MRNWKIYSQNTNLNPTIFKTNLILNQSTFKTTLNNTYLKLIK